MSTPLNAIIIIKITLTDHDRLLTLLSTEILICVFTCLPSLSDVIYLVAASSRLRLVYTENLKQIYKILAPRVFPYHQLARQLLADGGGPELHEPLSPMHVATMLHNWMIVKASMAKFEVGYAKGYTE
jgi:hypothetical protein